MNPYNNVKSGTWSKGHIPWNKGTGNPNWRKEYYLRTRDKQVDRMKKYYYSHRDEHLLYRRKYDEEVLKSWVGIIPEKTNCQMCGVEIFFNIRNQYKSIHFDHRHGGSEQIKNNPARWLRDHRRNSKTEAVWKSCDFGMLCMDCNRRLPTKDRIQFIINASKYLKSYN